MNVNVNSMLFLNLSTKETTLIRSDFVVRSDRHSEVLQVLHTGFSRNTIPISRNPDEPESVIHRYMLYLLLSTLISLSDVTVLHGKTLVSISLDRVLFFNLERSKNSFRSDIIRG